MAFWEAWKLAFLLRVLVCTNRTKSQIHPSPPKKKTKKRKKLAGNEKLLNINITEVSTKLVGAVFPELRWVVSFMFCASYSLFFLSEVYVCEIITLVGGWVIAIVMRGCTIPAQTLSFFLDLNILSLISLICYSLFLRWIHNWSKRGM